MTFATVSWPADSEVTSAKLQQMSDNDDHLRDNQIQGNVNVLSGDQNALPCAKTPGINVITNLEVVQYHFDSVAAVTHWDVEISIPPKFSVAPVVFTTVAAQSGKSLVSRALTHCSTSTAIIRIWEVDIDSTRMSGTLNVLFLGY